MKYLLLFIACCTVCNAQDTYENFTKITAFRLVNEYDNVKPCSIKTYIDKEQRVGRYVQAYQFEDNEVAYELMRLKKEAKMSWHKIEAGCTEKCSNCETVPNMLVVQINRFRDTIYTTKDHCSFYFPDEQAQYFDSHGQIQNTLSQKAGHFFNRDYTREIEQHKPDSIPAGKVQINNISIYGRSRKNFEKGIGRFQLVRTDSVFLKGKEVTKQYYINNLQAKFDDGKINELNTFAT